MTTRDRYGEPVEQPIAQVIPLHRPDNPEPEPVTPTEAGLEWLDRIRRLLTSKTTP